MAIPESQLTTWSAQGAITQSKNTYDSIRRTLESPQSPYAARNFSIFLQGSYANDTNVYRDSDVDVVIRLDDAFLSDLNELDESAKKRYQSSFSNATYGYFDFKRDVAAWLQKEYGNAVTVGTKAISIAGDGTRRDADVLPCMAFRRYYEFQDTSSPFHAGICFYRSDGTLIVNFPKQHSDNCTAKHQITSMRFKHMVRVLKNMRNRMIDEDIIEDGLAPSYYLEGLLYNVPSGLFEASYEATFVSAINWLDNCDQTELLCANRLYYLLRDNSPVCWPPANYQEFRNAIVEFWNGWS